MKNIDLLLNKYWECDTTIQEETQLQEYFASGNVADEHKEFAPLFGSYNDLKSMTADNIDVEAIFKAEAAKEANATSIEPAKVKKEQKTKVFSLKRYIPAVAASLVLVVIATMYNNGTSDSLSTSVTPEKHVVLENKADQEEAIKVTREALELLGKNYKKGTDAVSNIKHIKNLDEEQKDTEKALTF